MSSGKKQEKLYIPAKIKNDADLDLIEVSCECGNRFKLQYDAVAFCNFDKMDCGRCGRAGKIDVID